MCPLNHIKKDCKVRCHSSTEVHRECGEAQVASFYKLLSSGIVYPLGSEWL